MSLPGRAEERATLEPVIHMPLTGDEFRPPPPATTTCPRCGHRFPVSDEPAPLPGL
jgi:hypothetical protein